MVEYIEREAALNAIEEAKTMFGGVDYFCVRSGIQGAPAADVVEVVRCKDCVSYNGHRYCNYHADPVMDDDFCSYGAKMNGKGERSLLYADLDEIIDATDGKGEGE